MSNPVTSLKDFISMCFCGLFAFLTPVHNAMLVLGLAFIADLLFGILTDVVKNDKQFSFRKFVFAAAVFLLYLSIVAAIHTVGWFMNDHAAALYVVKTVTYMFVYFLAKNSLKNLRILLPHNEAIVFLDNMLGFEFTKRFSQYFDKKDKQHEDRS